MGINPFKSTNLEDLQQITRDFLSDNFGFILDILKTKWNIFLRKEKERITIMLIPHSEKKIINFHVPIYSITLIISAVLIIITITSIAIINHASTIKDVSRLRMLESNSTIQIARYKDEIKKLCDDSQAFNTEVKNLYELINKKDADSLWAKGGVPNPNPIDLEVGNYWPSPSDEELNIKDAKQKLKITKETLAKIKDFLEKRKRIIENTPSIWPTQGYIIHTACNTGNKSNERTGIEIAAFPGAEIKATAYGDVENVEWDPALGLKITISHKYGFTTLYSHCSKVIVKIPEKLPNGKIVKQKVSKGETIGYVGRTGKADRHICYYQVKIGTEPIDPMKYLIKLQ